MLELKNITKQFKKQVVLNNITLNFSERKIFGLIGRNGSGKTVLIKLMSGLSKPSSGKIYFNDKLIGEDIEHPDSMGLIIESPGFLLNKTGLQNLIYLASLKNKITKDEVIENIKKVGLDPFNKKHVGKYSLGMKQKLGIAQAIMEKPKLLLLDEPFNSLDEESVNQMRELLLEIKKEGTTIIIATHIKDDVEILCDRVYKIEDGNIIN